MQYRETFEIENQVSDMAEEYRRLLDKRGILESKIRRLENDRLSLIRSNAALRGALTKLKKKLNQDRHE